MASRDNPFNRARACFAQVIDQTTHLEQLLLRETAHIQGGEFKEAALLLAQKQKRILELAVLLNRMLRLKPEAVHAVPMQSRNAARDKLRTFATARLENLIALIRAQMAFDPLAEEPSKIQHFLAASRDLVDRDLPERGADVVKLFADTKPPSES